MIRMAPAKLNWYLEITGKRPNGYHELQMLNQRLSLADTLEFESADALSLVMADGSNPVDGEDNIILKAARMLKDAKGVVFGAKITLRKRIPMGAGLGGGSADAATTLLGLLELWCLTLKAEELNSIALRLGADVPYCLTNSPALVSGIGETVLPMPPFPTAHLLLLKPQSSLNTRDVFSIPRSKNTHLRDTSAKAAIDCLKNRDYKQLYSVSRNDLQASAMILEPEITTLLEALKSAGATFAQMSGSGTCVYGVFHSEEQCKLAERQLQGIAPFICRCYTI